MKGDELASGKRRSASFFMGNSKPSPNVGASTLPEPTPIPEEIEAPKPRVGYRAKPVGDMILVMRVERDHTSNLIIPDSAKAKSDSGFIVSVGEKVTLFKQGQLVLYDKFAAHGQELELVDEEGIERIYLMLREYDILLILEKITL